MDDLLDRWQRVETFSHSSNRLLVRRKRSHGYRLMHVSKASATKPSLAETLLVVAVVTMLGELATGNQLALTTDRGQPLRVNGLWSDIDVIDWSGAIDIQATERSLDEVLLPTSIGAELVAEIRNLIAQDLVRRWSAASLAKAAGMSKRTLQRRLSENGATFSRLISDVRLESAANYLCQSDGPSLGAIGFLTGFSDQAHFSRSFCERVGIPPQDYRRRFGR